MSQFYDGTKLLSLKDKNGKTPEIYICTSNRSAGKTVFYNRLVVRRFLSGKGKFILIYRFNYELSDCADKFFKDIGGLFFPDSIMQSKRKANGLFHELFLDDVSCGYAIALNSADQLKKYSHLLSDATCMVFDEFQSETNHYCPDEVKKFISVHTSVARGGGLQYRPVPVFMLSNPVSLINPYYTELGISERLRTDTKFLRGDGFVMEQGFISAASEAQLEGGFNRAFSSNDYIAYSAQCVYLNDSQAFIEKPIGVGRYLATLKYKGTNYAVREYAESGFLYVDDNPDMTFKTRVTVTTEDHQVNYIMLKNNDYMLGLMRYYFEKGLFRFRDLRCKEALIKALSY